MSSLTLVSRVLGFVRDILTTHVLGASWATGAFVLAWMVPNLLRRLFGEGALSAAFVPVFTRAIDRGDRDGARRLLASVSGRLILGLGIAVLAVCLTVVLLPTSVWGRGESIDVLRGPLVRDLLLILFPYVLPVCVLALYAGALNALGTFAIPTAAPALLNLFWIGGLCWALNTPTSPGEGDALGDAARIVALSVACGGLAQIFLGIVPLARKGMLPRPRLRTLEPEGRQVFRTMGPAVLGLSMVQLNLLLDQGLAEYLLGYGGSTHVYLANRLLLLPHALVALPLATAAFPTLSAQAGRVDHQAMLGTLRRAMELTLFVALPAAVGLICIAPDLIEVGFEHGQYQAEDATRTRWTTIALVAALPGLGASQLYARALFATGDVKTPARIAAWLVVLNLSLNIALAIGLGLGVPGFALATTICAYTNALAMRRRLARSFALGPVAWGALLRSGGACAVMGAGLLALRPLLEAETRVGRGLLQLLVPIAVGILIYLLVQTLLGGTELRSLWRGLRARRAARAGGADGDRDHSARTKSR